LLLAMLAWTGRAAACDMCGCYTPQLESLPPAESAAGRSWLTGIYGAIAEQFTHFDTVQVDGNEVSNPTGQHLDSFITQLVGGYSFNEVEIEGAPPSGIHGHDLTLGTGSYDGIFGEQVSLRYESFFFEQNLQFTLRGDGLHQYHFANDLSWSGGPGYYLVRNSRAIV